MNCTAGHGPDLLFRFPIPPYFDEPYGDDCYFSNVGYGVFGGVLLVPIGFCLILHVVTLTEPNNQVLRTVLLLQTLVLLSMMIAIVIGWLAPRGFMIMWMIFFLFLFLMGGSLYYLGYSSLVLTIKKVDFGSAPTLVREVHHTIIIYRQTN